MVVDQDAALYEIPSDVLSRYRVSDEQRQQFLSSHQTNDAQGFIQDGYQVRQGDSLWAIAQRLYGDGALWPYLFAANADQIRNPHLIFPGQVLRLI
ncbi:MAG: LysM peptidoglycan-binding domain-containing protein [Chloroflexi bacterium]|nr:LysM peptidoglycan-binding domain-containing protein [Chloroflexota bacterium]